MKVKKKIAAVFMSMLLCIMAVPLGAVSVSAETYGDLTYYITDGEVTIDDCDENATSVDIPAEIDGYQVTSIGNNAFDWCTSLTSITIPDSVTSIGDYAFAGCDSLTSITIPDSVTSIDCSAFAWCESLTSITVDENNQNYSSIDGVLFNKDKTEIIEYPDGKKDSVYIIPDSVTSIGDWAFEDCTSLTSITIPDSVTSIGGYAFSDCDSLTSITVDENNQNYSSIDGVLFNKDKTEIIAYPAGKKDSVYVVPNSVISIGNSAFAECALTSIIIPDSVTSIDWYAFEYCELLESITIPDSVTSIGYGAFSGCDNLTIYGYTGSTAETYANENNIDFIELDWVLANGDVTGDDKLTTEDVLWLRKYIIGKKSMSANQAASADLNGDGIINSFDVVMMKKVILTAE